MEYKTYQEIREKVQRDLDLQDELFITPEEMMGYCNEAIDEAEAEIHTIYEDYFLTDAPLPLVLGQSEYSLPSNIYANKIRGIIYNDGTTIYPITKVKNMQKFETIAFQNKIAGPFYRYYLKNNSASEGVKLVLLPAAKETAANKVKIYYIRNANKISSDSDVCDIPEFTNFILQFMKVRCYEKEGHPNLGMALQALQHQRELMVSTLTQMIPDNDDTLPGDFSYYEEMN